MKILRIIISTCVGLAGLGLGASATAAELDFTVTPFAGAASAGSADGPGTNARFREPQGLLLDAAGNLLVADTGNRTIRKISPSGQVSTYAGVVGKSEMVNGPAATARFNAPTGLAQDSSGNVYVADQIMVRKITPDGTVSTLAGWPFIPHVNPPPIYTGTTGLTTDASGNVYIAAYITNQNYGLSRITPDGTVSTLYVGGNEWPHGVALDSTGKIFYTFSANGFNEGISSLSSSNVPTRFVGRGSFGSTDGTGTDAAFTNPFGLKFAANGNLYVADTGNNMIRIVTPTGQVSTLAGTPPADGTPTYLRTGDMVDGSKNAARFWGPYDVAIDPLNNVFVVDAGNNAIRKVTPTGETSTIAGLYPASAGNINATGTAARFRDPRGVAAGPAGEIYIADAGNRAVRKVTPTGVVTTLAVTTGVPLWTAADAAGNVFVSEDNGVVEKITRDGVVSTFAGPFASAAGLAVDLGGNVFVADTNASVIRKITPGGSVSILSLTADSTGSSGSSVLLKNPLGLTLDATGNVYVVNQGSPTTEPQYGGAALAYVSKITPAGVTSVIAGLPNGWTTTSPNDPQRDLTIFNPRGIAIDPLGNLYVTAGWVDSSEVEQKLFRIAPSAAPALLTIRGSDGKTEGLFRSLIGIAIDRLGALYVADNAINFNVVNKIMPSGTLPIITTQPQSQTVTAGSNAQVSVAASGNPAPTYQWYFNQTAISGATGISYSMTNVQAKEAGDYSVVVTNAWGSTTSAKATLTLGTATTPPPTTTPGSGSTGGGGGGDFGATFGIMVVALTAARHRLARGK